MARFGRICCAMLVFFLCTGHAGASQSSLKPAVLALLWVPHAQFAGFYMALERGFYEKQGIDLTIMPGKPNRDPVEFLVKGVIDFAILWLPTGIGMRAEGTRILNVGQLVQRSSYMLVAKKSRGIHSPQDIDGKRVGLWADRWQVQPKIFFNRFNLQITAIPQNLSLDLFLRDGVDVASATWYNEYHTIINSGYDPQELTVFFFSQYDLNFPEDGIYLMQETLERDPDMCRGFVAATIAGWRHAFDHPQEALKIVMTNLKKAHIPASRSHQRWMLMRMKDLMLDADGGISMGRLREEDYTRVAGAMKDEGTISIIPAYSDFYRDCHGFIEK